MPHRQQAAAVLSMWREVEREISAAAPGSPELEGLTADAARLRDEYQQLVQETLADDSPAPPAWPDPEPADA